ncbi:hypothetical protein ACFRDV_06475 [Streptomyces fagopyri]|uniref:hypothetical protein n=1 Tax=Streptomyces fagopyri TaxID=2662397 RepID=UPI00369E18C4
MGQSQQIAGPSGRPRGDTQGEYRRLPQPQPQPWADAGADEGRARLRDPLSGARPAFT